MLSPLALLVLLLLSVPAVPGARAAGGFSASCSNFFVHDNHFLVAHCADGHGEYKDSALDLNLCIWNNRGLLTCGSGGNYGASCSGCALRSGTSMLCACEGVPEGTHVFVDLNDCVANHEGNLACVV